MLTGKEIRTFQQILKDRFRALREEIRLGLLESDHQQFIELAGKVYDREEASVANLLVDVQLASITRDVEELRDVDAALMRIVDGGYGVCTDCEEPIAIERLNVYPTAKRCRSCQVKYESLPSAGPGKPSL